VSCTVGGGTVLNVPVTDVLLVSITLQVLVPLQAPDQPANTEPAFGVSARVTAVPLGKAALHTCPQVIPDGVLVIVPPPVPLTCALN
jgi:hypothetical protein